MLVSIKYKESTNTSIVDLCNMSYSLGVSEKYKIKEISGTTSLVNLNLNISLFIIFISNKIWKNRRPLMQDFSEYKIDELINNYTKFRNLISTLIRSCERTRYLAIDELDEIISDTTTEILGLRHEGKTVMSFRELRNLVFKHAERIKDTRNVLISSLVKEDEEEYIMDRLSISSKTSNNTKRDTDTAEEEASSIINLLVAKNFKSKKIKSLYKLVDFLKETGVLTEKEALYCKKARKDKALELIKRKVNESKLE